MKHYSKVILLPTDVDEKQFLTTVVRELWADLRSYNSNIWQIMAFTLVAMAIFVNALSDGQSANPDFVLTFAGCQVVLFLSVFLFLVQRALWEISVEAKQRLRALELLEGEIQGPRVSYVLTAAMMESSGKFDLKRVRIAGGLPWFPVEHVRMVVLLGWALTTLAVLTFAVIGGLFGVPGAIPLGSLLIAAVGVGLVVIHLLPRRKSVISDVVWHQPRNHDHGNGRFRGTR